MSIILGIADGHGASAALMRDGTLIGIVQEERLSKVKNQTGFPKLAIDELVADHLGGDFGCIDHVVLASHTLDPYLIALDHYSKFGVQDWVKENHDYWKPVFYGDPKSVENYWRDKIASGDGLNPGHNFDLSFLQTIPRAEAAKHFNEEVRPGMVRRLYGHARHVERLRHHDCHAYYALYGGELSEADRSRALILTADAWGDGENWSAWTARPEDGIERLAGGSEHSIARIYKFVTLILGMKPNEHEYKVMGLSAYTDPKSSYAEEVEAIFLAILDFENGQFISRSKLRDSYFDVKERLEGYRFDNIAAGLQSWASKVTAKWVQHWLSRTGRNVLCFSGGLSMNIKLNGDLLALPELRILSVPASGGDESLSAGACFFRAVALGERVQPLKHVYLGSEANGASVPGFEMLDGIGPMEIARLLAANIIVARCAGRSEFGARSLGNRSILANPSDPDNLGRINRSVKNRDFWMPFTPSIMAEHADDLLVNPKGIFSPYMTVGFATKPSAHKPLAAALHPADKSARPQMVRKQDNPEYWAIINCFRLTTGIPALLNTSLNLHGDPMNYSVADALRTVAGSDLTCLIIAGDRLICKAERVAAIKAVIGGASQVERQYTET